MSDLAKAAHIAHTIGMYRLTPEEVGFLWALVNLNLEVSEDLADIFDIGDASFSRLNQALATLSELGVHHG